MLAILIKIIHFVVCVGLIVIVLLQADKGEGLAGAFGGGASNTVFGERGAGTIISKLTTIMAVVFMITSLLLSVYISKLESKSGSPEITHAAPLSVPAGQMPVAAQTPVAPAAPVATPITIPDKTQ